MKNMGFVFSHALNVALGRIVHVDDVPNGAACGCVCPYCKEPLIARHGTEYEHGFAHRSETRKANLEICYMVTLYKLAEQIIQTEKRIHAPSYYGIFKAHDLVFQKVMIDDRYERDDRQPDVIGITAEGVKYIIEFVFKHKVRHKQSIDYQNTNVLEVDISNQTLSHLREFLLSSEDDRRWLNNLSLFQQIEPLYHKAGKDVRVVPEKECDHCLLKYCCCAVKIKKEELVEDFLVIENNGEKYRLCKTEEFNKSINLYSGSQTDDAEPKSCFDCAKFKKWSKEDEFGNCGSCPSLGITIRNNTAKGLTNCEWFRKREG